MNRVTAVNDGTLLYGLLAEMAGDIVINTDASGFIHHASPGLDDLGVRLSEMLITPHLSDLAIASDREAIHKYIEEALSGICITHRLEFVASAGDCDGPPQWYCLTLRPTPDNCGEVVGLLGIIRQIEPAHVREEQLLAAAMTDTLTGLPNRRAFIASASQLLHRGPGGALALLEINDFRAVGLRFGQIAADEVIKAFAQFLIVIQHAGHSVARMEGGRFALLMPEAQQHHAFAIVEEIVSTFARVTTGAGEGAGVVTASAGVATMAGSLDAIMARAERALVLARAGGGTRAESGDIPPHYLAWPVRA
jgi:diguanylate cyclase (GGDEF)-like protein